MGNGKAAIKCNKNRSVRISLFPQWENGKLNLNSNGKWRLIENHRDIQEFKDSKKELAGFLKDSQ
jgi:hypothetical protein